MAAAPSPPPSRFPSGLSLDQSFQPLYDMGLPNPLFYHLLYDDFDQEINETGAYTKTTSGNGTIALTAGDGGLALFTTNTGTPLAADIAAIQLPVAGFSLTAGKKSFFLTRLQISDAVNEAFNVGWIQTTATPFTVTDGIYFNKATGSAANLQVTTTVGSTPTTIVIPTSAYTLANNTFIDLGLYVNKTQDILVFVGGQLVGWIPQSGTGAVNTAGVTLVPNLGPAAALRQGAPGTGTVALTAVNLNPTLAFQSGTASSKTAIVDFWLSAKER